ncbi:MAG TPA: hypothetical protein VLE19_06145 [Pyrinomonadaceae bacterium]|nr:hypothetical protein [Pyrinomonadaceae bacterium]
MNAGKRNDSSTNKVTKKNRKRKKKTALVVCRDRKQFWTTQAQFWQWVREGVVVKTGDQPLTGLFKREHEELLVLLSNTVLNLAHPNHMREALLSRRVGMAGK